MLPSPSDRLLLQRRHIAEMHPRRSRGKICTARAAQGGHGWDEGLTPPSSKALSRQLAEAEVEYQGQLRFSGRRGNANVTGIGAASLDFDHYKPGLPYAHLSAEDVVALLIEAYDAAGIPRISLGQDSGRGAYATWLFTAQMDGKALPRWQAAIKGLRGPKLDADGNVPAPRPRKDKDGNLVPATVDPKVEAFNARMLPVWRLHRDLGLDTGAIDPARVLKVMGTIHRETGRMSRMAWPSSWDDVERVDFDSWCDALMPRTRSEMRQLRQDRAAWKAENPDWTPAVRQPRRPRNGSKWAMIGQDLDRLLEHHGQAWFAHHHVRDFWVLFRAISIAMTEGGDARAWAERLAPRIGLPVREVASSLKGVETGMHAADAGERRSWKGTDRPAFYDYSYATIAERMLVDVTVAADASLLVLFPEGAPARTPAERQRTCRAAKNPNRATRDSQSEDRLGWGSYARLMRLDGATYADLCVAFGRSEDTIRKAIREVEVALSEPAPADEQTIQTPEEVSHSIVVEDPAASASPQAPASDVPPGSIRVTRHTRTFATVETATARWEWLLVEWERSHGRHEEWRLMTPAGMVSPDDAALADRARQELVSGSARPSRRTTRPMRRLSSRTPVATLQTAPLPPLDPAREAELYREASGGSSMRRRWHPALVAA